MPSVTKPCQTKLVNMCYMSLAQVQKIERNYTKNKSIDFKSLTVIVTTFTFSVREKKMRHTQKVAAFTTAL